MASDLDAVTALLAQHRGTVGEEALLREVQQHVQRRLVEIWGAGMWCGQPLVDMEIPNRRRETA